MNISDTIVEKEQNQVESYFSDLSLKRIKGLDNYFSKSKQISSEATKTGEKNKFQ